MKAKATENTLMLMALAFLMAIMPSHAAKVVLRLHEDDGQYSVFPDIYPVSKSKTEHASW